MRPALDWFSPLPPTRSGIATHYTAALEEPLRALCDIRLFGADPRGERTPGAIPVYQMGNHAGYHGFVWRAMMEVPGVVVIHDTNLLDFFLGMTAGGPPFTELLGRFYGKDAEWCARAYRDGCYPSARMHRRFSLLAAALNHALGVVVHSRAAFDTVRKMGHVPVMFLPLCYPAPVEVPERTRVADGQLRLVMPGLIPPNRRIESVLRAMATFSERERLRLDLYGELWDRGFVERLIEKHKLGGQVTFHGYVGESELNQALVNADLAVNVRYPTMGEASGTQLRLWQLGVPTLGTREGWYAEQPEQSMLWVRPSREQADLHGYFRAALAGDPAFRIAAETGRALFHAKHRVAEYARELVEFAVQVRGRGPHAMATRILQEILPAWRCALSC